MQTTDNLRSPRRTSASTAIAVHAVLLSLSGAWWLADGGPWVQVAALSLPVAVGAIWVASQLVTVLGPALRSERLAELLRVSLVAMSGAASIAMTNVGLAVLTGGASSAQLLFEAVRNTLLALPVALVMTMAVGALLSVRFPGRAHLRLTLRRTGFAVVGASLVFTGAGVLPRTATPTADAATAEDGPCPTGAPTKSFDVQSINVDIPYNRFGDHDPNGRMYVLSNRIADVREQEASQEVSIGLRDDPIQPLVIRANQGECVSITYTNNADGGDFGLHVDGLPFASDSSGDAVGRNAASNPAKGGSRTYRYWIPVDPTLEGAHYLHPGPGFRDVANHGLFGSLVVESPGSTYLDPNAQSEAQARPPSPAGKQSSGQRATRSSARTCSCTTRSATRTIVTPC